MVKQYNQKFRVGQGGVKEVSSDVTLGEGEDQLVLVDASAGDVTVTLQRADGSGGKRLCIKRIDSSVNVVTITPAGSQTIDGQTSIVLTTQNEALDIISDNENWLKLVKLGTWKVIEDFEFPDDSINSKTFNFPPVDFEDDSMLVLIADFSLTSGSGAFTFTVNGITGGWVSDGRRIINGVETIIDEAGLSQGVRLVTDAMLTNSNIPVHLIAYIQLNKVGTAKRVGVQSFANGVLITGNENISHTNSANITEISSITMTGRIRNFQTGSRITLYKVSRLG